MPGGVRQLPRAKGLDSLGYYGDPISSIFANVKFAQTGRYARPFADRNLRCPVSPSACLERVRTALKNLTGGAGYGRFIEAAARQNIGSAGRSLERGDQLCIAQHGDVGVVSGPR